MSKHPYPQHIVEAVKEQLAKGYGDLYVCTRDDAAWSYGTMSLDDFHRLDSDEDVLDDLANDMLGMLWDASRIDSREEFDALPDDAIVHSDNNLFTDFPAHVIYWGESDE